jgi:DNA-binding transcriptional LysR family regulator
MQRMAESHGIALRMRVRVNSFDSMLSMIRAGIGIGFVPKSVAELFASGPDFHIVVLQEALARRQFAICQRPEGELTSAAALALGFLIGLASPGAKAGSLNRQWAGRRPLA